MGGRLGAGGLLLGGAAPPAGRPCLGAGRCLPSPQVCCLAPAAPHSCLLTKRVPLLSFFPPPPAGTVAEYKYVLLDAGGKATLAWQPGNNNVLAVRLGEELVEVFDTW